MDTRTACPVWILKRASRIVGALLGVLLMAAVVPQVRASMPSIPIVLTVEADGEPTVGGVLTVTVSAMPLMATERLTVKLTVPDGVEIVAGDTAWSGPARGNETYGLTVVVRPLEAEYRILRADAWIQLANGRSLRGTQPFELNLGDRTRRGRQLPPLKKSATGESLLEFRNHR